MLQITANLARPRRSDRHGPQFRCVIMLQDGFNPEDVINYVTTGGKTDASPPLLRLAEALRAEDIIPELATTGIDFTYRDGGGRSLGTMALLTSNPSLVAAICSQNSSAVKSFAAMRAVLEPGRSQVKCRRTIVSKSKAPSLP